MFFLNHFFEFPDQRSKFADFFLSTGVIWETSSLSLVSDSGCSFSCGLITGVSVRVEEQVVSVGLGTKLGARKC